jgi:hypothetical protein
MVAALLSSLALGLSISPPRVEPLRWAFDTVATLELGLFPGLRLGVDIERRTAGGKGDGIYALRTIPEGATVGRYEGVVIKRQEYMDGELSSDYVFDLGENVPFMLDAQDPTRSNWCRFMNHNVRRANVEACMSDTGCFVYFEAGRDIAAGEELLIDCAPRPRPARKLRHNCASAPPATDRHILCRADGAEYWDNQESVGKRSIFNPTLYRRMLVDYGW